MRILVTGATGFMGRHILRQINDDGHDILTLGLEKIEDKENPGRIKQLCGNMADIASLRPAIKSFDPEVVIHLAWQGIPDYSEVISLTNLNDSIRLFDFITEETGCKKIIASGSCFEYGKNKGVCRESDSVRITSFFSWAKYSLYRYLLLKCEQKKVVLIWFRIFYAYGPYQRDNALIPALVGALKDGRVPEIRSPLNKNDFIHAEDIAAAFRAAVDTKAETGIYNIGSGVSRSVYDVCRITEKYFPESSGISESVLRHGSKEREFDFSADISKTVKSFGWRPGITLEEGISKYIEFFKRKE